MSESTYRAPTHEILFPGGHTLRCHGAEQISTGALVIFDADGDPSRFLRKGTWLKYQRLDRGELKRSVA